MADLRALIRETTGGIRNLVPGGADTLEVSDIDYAGALTWGVNATGIDIGQAGVTTTIKGNFQVDGTTTLVSTSTLEGDVQIGDGGNTITIGGDGGAGAGDTINLGTVSTGAGSDSDVTLRTLMTVDGAAHSGGITGDDATFDFTDVGCGVLLPTVGSGSAVASNGSIIVDGADFKWHDGATWHTAGTAVGGNTLDQAYDQGGAGLGRVITADSGAVEITASNAADYGLKVTNSGNGGALFVNSTGTGAIADLQDGGSNVFQIADGGAFDIDASTFDLDASGAVNLDAGANAIGIGAAAETGDINIGTGAAVRTITVGNTTGATALVLRAGTGDLGLLSHGALTNFNEAGANAALVGFTEDNIIGALNELKTEVTSADAWEATADEAISIGDAICGALAAGTDDRVNQANADTTGTDRQYCLGFAKTAAAGAGSTCDVQSTGLAAAVTCPNVESWTKGDAIYLDDVVSQVSNVAPVGSGDVVQRVGWAAETNATGTSRTMFISIGEPTVL